MDLLLNLLALVLMGTPIILLLQWQKHHDIVKACRRQIENDVYLANELEEIFEQSPESMKPILRKRIQDAEGATYQLGDELEAAKRKRTIWAWTVAASIAISLVIVKKFAR